MQYKKMLENVSTFTDKLKDDESRQLFDLRFQYLIKRDQEAFYDGLDKILQSSEKGRYSCWRLD